jgi:hypothetical protein
VSHLKEDFVFRLGIIDFLTEYNTAKNLENTIKSKWSRVDKNEISAVD